MRLIIGNMQGPVNPVLRVVSMLVGAVVLVAALFFGALVLVFVLGFVAIVAAVAAVRIWWFRRRLRKAAAGAPFRASSATQRDSAGGRVIEGEFADVSESATTRGKRSD